MLLGNEDLHSCLCKIATADKTANPCADYYSIVSLLSDSPICSFFLQQFSYQFYSLTYSCDIRDIFIPYRNLKFFLNCNCNLYCLN